MPIVESINRIRLRSLWPAGTLTTNPFTRRELNKKCGLKGLWRARSPPKPPDAKFSRVRATLDFCTCYWKDLQARRITWWAGEKSYSCVSLETIEEFYIACELWENPENQVPLIYKVGLLLVGLQAARGHKCVFHLILIPVISGIEPKINPTRMACDAICTKWSITPVAICTLLRRHDVEARTRTSRN